MIKSLLHRFSKWTKCLLTCVIPDSFTFTYHKSASQNIPVPLLRNGITWYTDKNIKFRNPRMGNLTLDQVFEGKMERGKKYLSFFITFLILSVVGLLIFQVLRIHRTGRNQWMSWIQMIQPTMDSSTMVWLCGWEKQPSPTLRSSTVFYVETTNLLPKGFLQETTASRLPTVSLLCSFTKYLLLSPWITNAWEFNIPVGFKNGNCGSSE